MEMEKTTSLKEYFGGESTGFTPWLEKHPEIIQDILGSKNATVYKREAKVDKFYIDLLFRDGLKTYVVENQYGESNHDHLGKCIVYSTLINSDKTIWIAEHFSEEYYKILKNINIDLCLAMVQLEQVDDYVAMKIYCHYKDGSTKQIIYKLNDREIIGKIQ